MVDDIGLDLINVRLGPALAGGAVAALFESYI